MKLLFFAVVLLISVNSFSQIKKEKRRVSNEKGAMFVSWGFNRSAYTKSTLRLVGSGYDFSMHYAKATDHQSPIGSGDYSITSISVPQYNFKVGYCYKKKWSIQLGLDHMKYVFSDNNRVVLNGFVSIDTNTVSFGNSQPIGKGFIESKSIKTNKNDFQYSNLKGLNYIHAELGWTEKLWVPGRKGNFVLSASLGLGTGIILSYSDLYYDGIQNSATRSVSGYGLSGFAGLRTEFFKNFFLYTNFSTGFLHKIHEKTSLEDHSAYASQFFGFSQIEAGVGILLYKRPKNGCDDCPVW